MGAIPCVSHVHIREDAKCSPLRALVSRKNKALNVGQEVVVYWRPWFYAAARWAVVTLSQKKKSGSECDRGLVNPLTSGPYQNHGLCYPIHSHAHDFAHRTPTLRIAHCTFAHPTASAHATPVLTLIAHPMSMCPAFMDMHPTHTVYNPPA